MWDTLYERVDIILTLEKNFISPDFVGRLPQNLAWSTSSDRTKASWKKKMNCHGFWWRKTGGFTQLSVNLDFFLKNHACDEQKSTYFFRSATQSAKRVMLSFMSPIFCARNPLGRFLRIHFCVLTFAKSSLRMRFAISEGYHYRRLSLVHYSC